MPISFSIFMQFILTERGPFPPPKKTGNFQKKLNFNEKLGFFKLKTSINRSVPTRLLNLKAPVLHC